MRGYIVKAGLLLLLPDMVSKDTATGDNDNRCFLCSGDDCIQPVGQMFTAGQAAAQFYHGASQFTSVLLTGEHSFDNAATLSKHSWYSLSASESQTMPPPA